MSKVILITGASSGIGRATAKRGVEKGHRVYGGSRSLRPDQEVPEGFTPLELDVRDEDSVNAAVEQVREREGRLDGLINCAGIGLTGPLEDTPIEEAQAVFDTNLFGVLRTSRAVLPSMRENGEGKIINIGSIGGQIPLPFRGIYCSSKSALEGMSRALSMEVYPFGVQIYLIHPGDFSTNINQNRIVVNSNNGSAYREISSRAREVIEREVADGSDPDIIADLVMEILDGKRKRRHYRVGKWLQRLTPVIRKVLPDGIFERQLMRRYRIDP